MTIITCAIAIPFIAGLQRYAVAYGYQGLTKTAAWRQAKGGFIGGVMISGILLLIDLASGVF